MKYTQAYDGEWMRPIRRRQYIRCCDCGLTHRLEFRVRGRHVEFRAYRLRRRTGRPR
jgi:hypothetical protein